MIGSDDGPSWDGILLSNGFPFPFSAINAVRSEQDESRDGKLRVPLFLPAQVSVNVSTSSEKSAEPKRSACILFCI